MQSYRLLAAAVGLAMGGGLAQGGVTGIGRGAPTAAWPASTDGATPAHQTILPTATTVANGFATGSVAAYTFQPSSTFNLGAIMFTASGAGHATPDMTFHLYELNTTYTHGTSGGYAPSTAVAASLVGAGGAGLPFQYTGSANFAGNTQGGVFELDFSGVDEVTLTAGKNYAFEIWNQSAPDAPMSVYRAGDAGLGYLFAAPSGGQAENSATSRNNVAGGLRTPAFAVYPVPEPGSLSLLGMAAVGMLARRRR